MPNTNGKVRFTIAVVAVVTVLITMSTIAWSGMRDYVEKAIPTHPDVKGLIKGVQENHELLIGLGKDMEYLKDQLSKEK